MPKFGIPRLFRRFLRKALPLFKIFPAAERPTMALSRASHNFCISRVGSSKGYPFLSHSGSVRERTPETMPIAASSVTMELPPELKKGSVRPMTGIT